MPFINFPSPTPLFPSLPGRGWSMHKIPTFSTSVAIHVNGKEMRAIRQAFPLWEFDITHEVLREQTQNQVLWQNNVPFVELETISQLQLSCLGKYGEFYFED